MTAWIQDHQGLLWFVSVASIAVFVASLFVIPALVTRIHPAYFAHDTRPPSLWSGQHRAVRVSIVIAKNILGVVLIVAGVAMLVLPGQGLLTVLIGFLLLDSPGKYRFEKWLIARPFIFGPVNWLRRRAGRVPLEIQ